MSLVAANVENTAIIYNRACGTATHSVDESRQKLAYGVVKRVVSSDIVNVSDAAVKVQNSVVREFVCTGGRKAIIGYCEDDKKVFAYAIQNQDCTEIKQENMPQEFSQIKSSDALSRFLENAYTMVSVLSDGEPRLRVEQSGLGGGKKDMALGVLLGASSVVLVQQVYHWLNPQPVPVIPAPAAAAVLPAAPRPVYESRSISPLTLPDVAQHQYLNIPQPNALASPTIVSLPTVGQAIRGSNVTIQNASNAHAAAANIQGGLGLLRAALPIIDGAITDINDRLQNVVFQTVYRDRDPHHLAVPNIPEVTRYGIDTHHLGFLVNQPLCIGGVDPLATLHPLETDLLQHALARLHNIGDQNIGEVLMNHPVATHLNNVILVDILARKPLDANAKIAVTNQNGRQIPETHTIVLWKKSARDVLLIDPSARKYSRHLAPAIQALWRGPVATNDPGATLASYNNGPAYFYSVQMYDNHTLPSQDDLRDCIDIGVKICFELLEQQLIQQNNIITHGAPPATVLELDIILNNILTSTIKQISNDGHANIPGGKVLRRVLQTSDSQSRLNALQLVDGNPEIQALTVALNGRFAPGFVPLIPINGAPDIQDLRAAAAVM